MDDRDAGDDRRHEFAKSRSKRRQAVVAVATVTFVAQALSKGQQFIRPVCCPVARTELPIQCLVRNSVLWQPTSSPWHLANSREIGMGVSDPSTTGYAMRVCLSGATT